MFISAIRSGLLSLELRCNLKGATLTSAASRLRMQKRGPLLFLSMISEAHCSVFGRLEFSFWILSLGQRAPSGFSFSPHHISANSSVPIVFLICIKLTLFVLVLCFCFKK